MLSKLLLAPLALLTAFFFAFSLVAVQPVLAADHEEETANEEHVENHDEGLHITVEEHGDDTHVHVYMDGEEETAFFLAHLELDEHDLIIEAVADETGYTVAEVEAAIHFPSEEDVHDEHEHEEEGDEHEHDDEEAHDEHMDEDMDSNQAKMMALVEILQQLIALLTKQVEMQADASAEASMGDEHDHSTHDHDEHEHDDEEAHDEHMDDMDETDEEDPYAGIHIMGDGSVMLGNGEVVADATVTADGMIELADGTLLEPEMDLR